MIASRSRRGRTRGTAALLVLAVGGVLAVLLGAPRAMSQTSVQTPAVEIVEEDGGTFATVTEYILDFQRRANAEIATHMNAIERGDNLGAFFLGLAIAFACGVIHAFGPGHGKFVIVSYFLGREVRVARGVVMAAQVAIVHVIAGVIALRNTMNYAGATFVTHVTVQIEIESCVDQGPTAPVFSRAFAE